MRIYAALRERMERGELPPGARLEGERELSRRFGVAVMTVRQALDRLQREGLVERRHGVGTFVVRRWIEYDLGRLHSFAQDMAYQEVPLETRVLSRRTGPAERAAEMSLQIEPGQSLHAVERLRSSAGLPIVYQVSYLSAELGERLDDAGLAISMYGALQAVLGQPVDYADETLQAVALPARSATLLGERRGAPGLLSERLTFAGPTPIVFDRAFMPSQRVRLRIARSRGQAGGDLAYQLVQEEA